MKSWEIHNRFSLKVYADEAWKDMVVSNAKTQGGSVEALFRNKRGAGSCGCAAQPNNCPAGREFINLVLSKLQRCPRPLNFREFQYLNSQGRKQNKRSVQGLDDFQKKSILIRKGIRIEFKIDSNFFESELNFRGDYAFLLEYSQKFCSNPFLEIIQFLSFTIYLKIPFILDTALWLVGRKSKKP